ncbi:muscular LMNA-interacting protein isoform X2 [Cheilinus undulatus]|uniref:muscular LMNA-interacting protein isoform X2 n=1 Tax=Cheilinus undulatus TaxID=241271 RepID=UPI001BD2296D|nr:muscular LMNA-interacting protein isoform X2 [Cheilinus undulatus]
MPPDGESFEAEMDELNTSLGKVLKEEQHKASVFTFVPVVWKLPVTGEKGKPGTLKENPNKNFAASHEEITGKTMSDQDVFKAERVFIRDCEEGGAGNKIPQGTKPQFNLSLDHMSLQSPSATARSENTTSHEASGTASMETAVYKHGGVSQPKCHDTSGLSEVSSGCFVNRVSEDRVSPTNSADLFPTPASSRESILSEGSDRDKSWSGVRLSSVTSPTSLSRTVSPCSSVLSGIFSPAVVQIKKHFLAPGSSLLQTPFSSCESLSSSVCPQSPPPAAPRHRPPLTRLSLLTAILRKGRLPVLSSALQRPYTPCWPVNPVTLSFCNACSAASSVASIPLEFSSRFSSSASIDSQSHVHRGPNRCITSPPPEISRISNSQTQTKSCPEKVNFKSNSTRGQVISPSVEKGSTLPRAPAFCSDFKSVSPLKREESDSAATKKLQHSHITISPEPKLSNNHMYQNNNLRKLISPSPKQINNQDTIAPQKWSPPRNSSLSRLHSLSQQLRSTPVCPSPPPLQPSHSLSTSVTCSGMASPLNVSQNTAGRCELRGSCPDSKRTKNTSHCLLSPSRYTPIIFSGWPSPADSPTPTPSPAPPVKSLTPSPSLSLRSTPSPRPGSGISDCSDREGKKRKTHKIKLSYKSLAAIPTNTLLLDQQAIDEQVERGESPYDTLDGGVSDTHAEMRSPSQLRQQSEELYAVIDEILANSLPPSPQPPRPTSSNAGLQNNSSVLKSLGRETKYASLSSLQPTTSMERKSMDNKKTKPGVIRPMTAIPRLTVEDEEEFCPNPFRQFHIKQTSSDNRKEENKSLSKVGKDLYTRETAPERRSPSSMCDLKITEPEDQISHQLKDSSPFSATGKRMNAFETHI